ncbi:HlyC/CorC family transporter [Oceanicoccus sagamiensis]|uniref:Magnesium and cobalt efflux protein CorC n=1 Tax=Oceanicoccus sagamiensis TaxID=716816 RepID=A0A1X9NGR0_9GAMM|nr:transporter associated domain-containing protein [Oceanicoccus sagamiensis]ARN74699.1 magnesium/cobalt efflux protein [Oceanicoccus sagamiensis]
MNEDRIPEPEEKSWLEKIAHAFSSEPKSRDDLLDILKVAQHNEVIDNDALKIIDGAMQVTEMQVREIMIPRTQMTVIKAEESLSELLPQIIKTAHSRYPVIGENTDEVLGILLAKDLLPLVLEKDADSIDITPMLRPATVVPESKRLNVLLREFREKRNHMAIVIDEYGGVAGLVTIEDVLEEIVGEIEDEHDVEPDSYIKKLAENDYIIKALTPIDDFNEAFEAEFSDEEFDTIGGIILQQFGHLPRRNEVATVNGYEFKVLNADSRQVHLLRMSEITAS